MRRPGQAPSLGDYSSKVDCTRNGQPAVSVPGTKVDGAIANGDVVVCTFTNTRTAPLPVPLPPHSSDPPAPDGPADPGAAARTHGRPQRAQDGHAGDRGAGTHDFVPDHGHESVARRRGRRECRSRLRALLPAEGALDHAVTGQLRAGLLQPRPPHPSRLGHDHGGRAGSRRRTGAERRQCQLRGAGNGLPQQHGLGARSHHRSAERGEEGRRESRGRHPRVRHADRRAARAASGCDLDRARPGPYPLRKAAAGNAGDRGGKRRSPPRHHRPPRHRPPRGDPERHRPRAFPPRPPRRSRPAPTVAPCSASSARAGPPSPAERGYGSRSIGVPSGASRSRARATGSDTRTQPCDTAWPSSWGWFVPWMPARPPPGQSLSFE